MRCSPRSQPNTRSRRMPDCFSRRREGRVAMKLLQHVIRSRVITAASQRRHSNVTSTPRADISGVALGHGECIYTWVSPDTGNGPHETIFAKRVWSRHHRVSEHHIVTDRHRDALSPDQRGASPSDSHRRVDIGEWPATVAVSATATVLPKRRETVSTRSKTPPEAVPGHNLGR